METTLTRSFVRTALPWLVAAAMLLVYLVTLDKVVTTHSVWHLARVNGSEWRPVYVAPLTWLVTLPVKWLPSGAQLLGLNFISAVCAAFSLAWLARSVSILPQDRTQLQRNQAIDENGFLDIRLAWVPVVIAVIVCGFQRSFWEHAVVGTGEMLDLLLFAYCVRCLLEYRIEEKKPWLYKLALVYGVGIANNFAMVAFFPALIAALVWIKGLRFFRFDFLSRMFLLGLAGMSFYLLLPLVQSQSEIASITFWQALKLNLLSQQHLLFDYRKVALLPAIYALVPLLFMGFRWARGFGDQSPMGSLFANAAAVILHAGLLAFCLYVAFDPPISPREMGAPLRQTGFNYVFLPCYFLGALAVGYYTGFLLLVFSGTQIKGRQRITMPPLLNYAITGLVCVGALFTAGALLAVNYPKIQRYNSRSLQDYANALIQSLPDKPAIVLSDEPMRLHAVGASLNRAAADKYILLDTRTLSEPAYHRFLRKRYGDRFPQLQLGAAFTGFPSPQLIQMLTDLGEKNDLIYLHPSFGYYFEKFYAEPANLAYKLKPYPTNAIESPVPSPALIAEQKAYWESLAAGPLQELKAELAKLPAERAPRYEFTAPYVGDFYARALDQWGVELQRAGRFDEAFQIFKEALALSPDNASALINRDANTLWREGRKRLPELSREHQEKLTLYRGVDMLLMSCGPVDEASFVTEFAGIFIQGGLYRQAEQMLLRGLAYAPTDVALQTALANIHVMAQQPDRALALISSIQNTNPAMQVELSRITAFAYYAKDDFARAKAILDRLTSDFPDVDASYNALAQLYLNQADRFRATGNVAAANEQITNAMKVIDRQIERQPKNPAAYFARGHIAMVASDYAGAVGFLDKVLQLQRDNGAALLNRAISNLQVGRLNEAKADYREFLKRFTPNYQVYYGLAEIAYRQKDWRGVRDECKEYFRYAHGAPPNEVQFMRKRFQEAKENS
jgi:tetratricopeptide (TPR) repeat protein